MRLLVALLCLLLSPGLAGAASMQDYPVPAGSGPHDVAPAADGGVWFTAQRSGALGHLDPATGKTVMVPLGDAAAPHGVILGGDGAAWVTDGGLNAIVRVDGASRAVKVFPLPDPKARANLNTAVFDGSGLLWFTGQEGVYGRLDPRNGAIRVWKSPKGAGPYGITATPAGIFYASLASDFLGRIDPGTGAAEVIEPARKGAGPRRAWADSKGLIWVSEWQSGYVSRWDPSARAWRSWRLPGAAPQTYAVYVDDEDKVWVSDWGANALLSFDPATEKFEAFPLRYPNAAVRQIHGRKGEVWAPLSSVDRLVVVRTR